MSCIILVGMPGAGKSTLGILLAKELTKDFIDTDVMIQVRANQSLQSIVDNSGYMTLRELEEQALLDLELSNHVIATGGSAVYSQAAMEHLKTMGPIIYLQVEVDELKRRVQDLPKRGIAGRPGQALEDLYTERCPLYEQAADLTLNCADKTPEQIVTEMAQWIERSARG